MALTKITSTNIQPGAIESSSLETSGATAGTYGAAAKIPVLSVNAQGIVYAISEVDVAGVTGFAWDSGTEELTISTADGNSFTADISGMASETYVDTAISNLIGGAPAALDTLNELAAAINDDASYAASITASLANKVDKINITGATVGSASQVPVITFNAQGQITSATTTAVAGVSGTSFTNGTYTISTSDGGTYPTDFDARYFTETEAQANFLGINAKATDSDALDGLNSTQFLRSDADDFTTGKLSVGSGTAGSMQLNVNGDIYLGDNSGTTFGVYSGGSTAMGSDGSVYIVGDANTNAPDTVSMVSIGFGNTAAINYDQDRGASLNNLSSPAASTATFYSNRMRFHKTLIIDPKTAPTATSEGAMYYDSNDNCVKFYNGSSWIPLTGLINRYSYTATAGQTTFNATYSGSNVDVFLNGIKLVPTTDFTASNGTSVVLTAGADAGDLVDIIAQTSSFAQSNAVPATGGTFTGTVSFDGASTNINVGNTVNASNLRLTNDGDLTVSGTGHAFQIGSTAGVNLSMDTNEIMARDNGALVDLHLQADGGKVTINNAGTGDGLYVGSSAHILSRLHVGATSAAPFPNKNLHIHQNHTGTVPFGSEPRIVISTNETAGAGNQGYYGSLFFGGQDVSTTNEYNWAIAGIASQSDGGDVGGGTGTGNLEFYVSNASSSPTKAGHLSVDGRWSVPGQPAFEMIKTTDTTGTANANNYIKYDLVQFETGGSGCNTSTGLYTAPADGLYHFAITFTVDAGDGTDDSMGVAFIIANNSYYNQNYSPSTGHRINPRFDSRSGIEHTYSFQKTARLSAGATIGFYITDWNDANTVLQHAEFSGHKFA